MRLDSSVGVELIKISARYESWVPLFSGNVCPCFQVHLTPLLTCCSCQMEKKNDVSDTLNNFYSIYLWIISDILSFIQTSFFRNTFPAFCSTTTSWIESSRYPCRQKTRLCVLGLVLAHLCYVAPPQCQQLHWLLLRLIMQFEMPFKKKKWFCCYSLKCCWPSNFPPCHLPVCSYLVPHRWPTYFMVYM